MKKVIIQLVLVFSLFIPTVSKAQLPNGSVAPDWTFTDINGNTQHLYQYLDSGYTVFFNVCVTWCPPCWGYHLSNAMQNLYINNGPAGFPGVDTATTNDVMVIFIEGDGTTTLADLNGTGPSTQGDYVTGSPYPIIDLTNFELTTFNPNYNINYWPTVYMVCPNRLITEVGQVSTSVLYADKASCTVATSSNDVHIIESYNTSLSLISCDSVMPSFQMVNNGFDLLTSATVTYEVDGVIQQVFTWTGSLTTYQNIIVSGPKVSSLISGLHSLLITVSNPNGLPDADMSNNTTTVPFNIISPSVDGGISESFEVSGLPVSWPVTNGGDLLAKWQTGNAGYSSLKSMKLNFYDIPQMDVDIVTLPNKFLLNGSTNNILEFKVAYASYSLSNDDELEVQVSTDCGQTWITEYDKAGYILATVPYQTSPFTPSTTSQWRQETVDLSAYAGGPEIIIRFKGTSDYGNNLYVDEINFGSINSLYEFSLDNAITIFPNPTIENAQMRFHLSNSALVSYTVQNEIGQQIANTIIGELPVGQHNFNLNLQNLENGLYFVKVKISNNLVTKKIVINR